jgi:hypothetical protein
MVYPDNIDSGYFNSQLGTRSDRRHYHLAHLQISLLSEHRSKPECPSAPPERTPAGPQMKKAQPWTTAPSDVRPSTGGFGGMGLARTQRQCVTYRTVPCGDSTTHSLHPPPAPGALRPVCGPLRGGLGLHRERVERHSLPPGGGAILPDLPAARHFRRTPDGATQARTRTTKGPRQHATAGVNSAVLGEHPNHAYRGVSVGACSYV